MSTPKYGRGTMILCMCPQADTGISSLHPALIVGDAIENLNNDYIAVQCTSRRWNGRTDVWLSATDADFVGLGLAVPSTIRCHKLFPVAASRVQSKIGHASDSLMKRVEAALRAALSL